MERKCLNCKWLTDEKTCVVKFPGDVYYVDEPETDVCHKQEFHGKAIRQLRQDTARTDRRFKHGARSGLGRKPRERPKHYKKRISDSEKETMVH